jgi:hypothetical protein
MKIYTLLFLLISMSAMAKFQYVSPMPGSELNNPASHIIIREGSFLDVTSVSNQLFSLLGSKSGVHAFRIVLSDDQKTILLYPHQPFGFDEAVTVSINTGLRTTEGRLINSYSFSFTTHREYTSVEKENFKMLKSVLQKEEEKKWAPYYENEPSNGPQERALLGSFTIIKNTDPSPGSIFYDAWNGGFGSNTYDGYNIITPDGDSVYASGTASVCFDFSLNPNGYLSVYNNSQGRFDVFDSNYVMIDSYYPGNGRTADPHEFTIYEDGHAFMVTEETHVVNMKIYNPNYSSNATVMTTTIQEFDQSKNVIFEWRAWDHVIVTESNQNLAFGYIDAVHTNSIDLDSDGNIISSHRHLNQVTKIDRNTGEFIWRLGGVMNEFTFINEPQPFNYQHDARRVSNGNITVWDNGNQHVPTHSMAKEYQLDEVNMTATLAWSFQPKTYTNTNAYFYAMGCARRLENGNTLIMGGWDNSSNQSNIFEVNPAGTVVWELALNNSKGLVGYRAAKFNWNPCAPVNTAKIKVKNITDHSAKVTWTVVSNATSYDIQYRKVGSAIWKLKNVVDPKKQLSNLNPNKTYEYQVRANCLNGFSSDWSPLKTFTTLPLRIAEEELQLISFRVHPNPTAGILNIEFETSIEEMVTLSIFDLSGKLIIRSEQLPAIDYQTTFFDLTRLTPGIYIAEAATKSGSKTVKFVKE